MSASTELTASSLQQMAATTATDYWNDSCSVEELTYAVARGATGATSNPTIVGEVLKKEMHLWRDRIGELIAENPTWTEDEVTWRLNEEMAVRGAELLLPVFEREGGQEGPALDPDEPEALPRCLAHHRAGAAFQCAGARTCRSRSRRHGPGSGGRGRDRRGCQHQRDRLLHRFRRRSRWPRRSSVGCGAARQAGEDISRMSPVCTMMVGRLDDWMQVLAKRDGILIDPGYVHWAGVACFKQAYAIFKERGYRARLLAAAYRHHLHWSELIGGDIVLTIPYAWQRLFNASDIEVVPRIDNPVPDGRRRSSTTHFPDFRRAYDPDGMTVEEFDSFGATVRTLRGFIGSYQDLVATVRDFMLPNPDVA